MKIKPFVKVGHRFGNVFLRLVHSFAGRRTSTMVRLSPEDASLIGHELIESANRSQGIKPKKLKLVRSGT